jgi:probable rRNA maturation factor
MILSLVDRRRVPTPPAEAALCAPWVLLCRLAGELGPAQWRVDVVLVDDAEMTGLNAGYRGAEGPTDVLSFSYLTEADPGTGVAGAGAGDRCSRLDLWPDPLESGDGPDPLVGEVVLAPGFITARCLEQGWAPDQEMALLVVHGCLHILGWEHDDEADRAAMMVVETAVLRGCGLPHPLAKGA